MSAAIALAPQSRRPQLVPDTFRGTSGALFWRVVYRPASEQLNQQISRTNRMKEVEAEEEKRY